MAKRGDNIRKRKDGRWEGRYKKGRAADGSIIYGSVFCRNCAELCPQGFAFFNQIIHSL